MIPISIAAFTLLLGLTAPIWFGLFLPPVRMFRRGADWLDAEPVTPPSGCTLTVHGLREHDKCGDKIVVAHHLADWSRDLERRIVNTLGFNTVISLVLVVVYVVNRDPALRAPSASWQDLVAAVGGAWPFSIVFAAALVEIIVLVRLVFDLGGKYKKVIRAAKPGNGAARVAPAPAPAT